MKTAIASRNAMLDSLCALANGGTLTIYSGSQPASPEDAATGDALVTHNLSATAFATASAGSAAANAISEGTADAAGTAAWFRVFTTGAAAVFDGSVGLSGADINLSALNIEANDTITISALTVTLPQ